MVTAVAAWSIWGSDMFPAEADPKGSKQFIYDIRPVLEYGLNLNRSTDVD